MIIFSPKRGFTLIELMVTVAIVALLTSIIMVSFSTARGKSRDGKRVSDVGQIQIALELFYDRCKQYPATVANPTSGITAATCPSGVNLSTFISQIPAPSSGSYTYAVNASPATDYVLMTTLENYSEVLKDDLDGSFVYSTTVDCGTANNGQGNAERNYCVGPK